MSLDNVLGVAGASRRPLWPSCIWFSFVNYIDGNCSNFNIWMDKKYRWIAWIGLLAILVVAVELIYTRY